MYWEVILSGYCNHQEYKGIIVMWENDFFATPPEFPQGEPRFLEDLKSWKIAVPHWDPDAQPGADDLDMRGGFTVDRASFPDPEGLLTTVYDHLDRFRNSIKFPEGKVSVKAVKCDDLTSECYRMVVNADGVTIEAGNTEGARRGLYYFEEQFCASKGAFLEKKTVSRNNWLKNRISRCFFGPIKRPPFNIDELMNDIDYYPEPYLDRLAQEGINGLWLTIIFREICKTSFLPENPDAERRREKLRRSVEKCRKYGIKIWTFAIEPAAWSFNNPKPADLPQGPDCYGPGKLFCPNSENSAKYLYECTNSLFKEVPHLGGLMLISLGERPTSCVSGGTFGGGFNLPCQKECKLSVDQIFAKVLKPMRQGIKDANPDAEMISWLYQPQPEQAHPWIYELPKQLSEDIILAYNFESSCTKNQLGKVRVGGDYWLSCIGPSDRFGRMAEAARGKCAFAAKLQVGCSHEVATIPFVPAPGLLYRKYQEMRRNGVSHVVQCWYFGNYPGTMNRTAAALAYEDFSTSEEEFLTRLAAPEWGPRAAEMAKVWATLTRAYMQYPLGYEFQYYGPMHDGTVWPLHLKSVLRKMPRTWKPDYEPAGDAVGEFLNNFDLAELTVLTRRFADSWNEGWEQLQKFISEFKGDKAREMDSMLIEALNCHFSAGADIIEFYFQRNRMLNNMGDIDRTVDLLENIVKRQIPVSDRMAELCEKDPRLGYHSEAEVYKYFPEKLKWRSETLKQLLANDFPALRAALAQGKKPSEVLEEKPLLKCGTLYKGDTYTWQADLEERYLKFTLEFDKVENTIDDQLVIFVGDRLASQRPWATTVLIAPAASRGISDHKGTVIGTLEETEKSWKAEVRLPLALLADAHCCRVGMNRHYLTSDNVRHHHHFPEGEYDHDVRLQYGMYSPDMMLTLEF